MTEEEGINFSFYSKPMAIRDIILANSAFTLRDKKNILLEEASRRLRSCSPHLSWPEKAKHMTTLNLQMLRCGHGEEFRSMITSRAVAKVPHLSGQPQKGGQEDVQDEGGDGGPVGQGGRQGNQGKLVQEERGHSSGGNGLRISEIPPNSE